MVYTKCPPRYKNVGLESFGNKKKVTEELLKQYCKNDEYLYQQVRKLLDLTDPETRKRFHPPYFDDEIKSFGYVTGVHDGKQCYKFDDGGEYRFGVNFNVTDDYVMMKEGIIYYDDESIIDWGKKDDTVDIRVVSGDDYFAQNGYAQILEESQEEITETVEVPVYSKPSTKTTVTQVTKKVGTPKLDSYCYGPYGSMLPNGWWYVGFDKDKNYNVKANWKKKPYKEGIPSKCRAMTFTAQHTGYITKVNINVISSSNKKSASPFSCELWKTKKGVPYGGAIARVEQSFIDSNAYSGAHIKTFKFNKKAVVTKGHKYAIVMRSPLSNYGACYRIAGWPRECYTNYMKGTYYYGYAYQSLDNGKTWIRYDKNAYGILNATASTLPIAFGFEVFVQPTKTVKKTKKKSTKKKVIGHKTVTQGTGTYRTVYSVGDHHLMFKLPVTNPIYQLTIDEGEVENNGVNGNEILWDISFDGEEFTNEYLIDDNMGRGAGDYDLSEVRPTFVYIRCNLRNTNQYETPILHSVKFTVHTDPAKKAYIRSLPYCPESETMLPACIWSEVNAKYEKEDNVDVEVDVVKEVEAKQTVLVRQDNMEWLLSFYKEYHKGETIPTFSSDDDFRAKIQDEPEFINYLKNLDPAVYVVSSFPRTDSKFYEYFTSFDLKNYPAYPMIGCEKLISEMIIGAEDFLHMKYNTDKTEVTISYCLPTPTQNCIINICFREPENVGVNQEGIIENMLVENVDYKFTNNNRDITFILDGENISKNIVREDNGEVKCFRLKDGTFDRSEDWEEEEAEINSWDIAEVDTDYVGDDYEADSINLTTGDVVELVVTYQNKFYSEHMNYEVDYANKTLTPKPTMKDDIGNSFLVFKYNPLWVRALTSDELPLKMDLWVERFTVGKDTDVYHRNSDGNIVYTLRTAPRDNLREVVLFDDEETLVRNELEEDVDFVVDYQKNMIVFNYDIKDDTPVTIRYTPNLTESSLSLGYRLDRVDTSKQAYVYGNYFTTRT